MKRLLNKRFLLALGFIILVAFAVYGWSHWISSTRVAFINYQAIELGQISKANDNPSIKVTQVDLEHLDELKDYDMIMVTAMGLQLDSVQREQLREASLSVPTFTRMVTNPANNINTVDSVDGDFLQQYLENGSRRNYRSMLNYIRKFIDGKKFRSVEPDVVEQRPDNMLLHIDPKNPDDDELGFNTVGEYNAFLRQNGLYREKAPSIIVTGMMGVAPSLVDGFERQGFMVYRVNRLKEFVMAHHIDSVRPAAVINMAHGRVGDYLVQYLEKANIPMFAPLNANQLVDKWQNDKQGMMGGFMSQSIVVPEIDGAIRPYVVFAHRVGKDGLHEAFAVPERLDAFVKTVSNYVRLQSKPNARKRVAIYYYKGPGSSAITASGMEVAPSLYNVLKRLRSEGYNLNGLPQNADQLEKGIQQHSYDHKPMIFGNVALLPQLMSGEGTDSFKIIHGTNQDPPQAYIRSYQWTQRQFKADALIHFGTHGSLEYTPRKQVALSSNDWPDRLVGTLPHFYIYTIGNVGEAMIAKRRSYAQIQSHLTPPFMQSDLRQTYAKLEDAIEQYNKEMQNTDNRPTPASQRAALKVKRLTVEMNIDRDLGLDRKQMNVPYTQEEIERIESFAEELSNEKVTGQLYVMGQPYAAERIVSSVYAMCTDPIAYGRLSIDRLKKRTDGQADRHQGIFDRRYRQPARALVARLLSNPRLATDELICREAGITTQELAMARDVDHIQQAPDAMSMMMQMSAGMTAQPEKAKKKENLTVSQLREKGVSRQHKVQQMPKFVYDKMAQTGKFPEKMMLEIRRKQKWYPGSKEEAQDKAMAAKGAKGKGKHGGTDDKQNHTGARRKYSQQQVQLAQAINALEKAIKNVDLYRRGIAEAPEAEMRSLINALNGGYTRPSSGGDLIVNPSTLPTGRNLYAVNAETCPTENAWEKGCQLADNTIQLYRQRHGGQYPHKVSYTLWSSEFVETEGTSIAQILYMLGVEPVWDAFGRVNDVRLIPSERLGRPRIDVVVQTSGQLRDLAASRLFLINKAVLLAAKAGNGKYGNEVTKGVKESERTLEDAGMSPAEAREVATYRVFGGLNGGYGTGIQEMVEQGDKWDKEQQIAEVYMHNMGAFYGDEKRWEEVRQTAFKAALTRTDVVVQPRQSNTWGPISLDHVYEFMGGINLTVRNVTGKDPDAYMSDYRNHNRMRMQEVKEAIGAESRTTILNPAYLKEKMKGGATTAGDMAETITNIYGWNVMKPKAIDKELWDGIYKTFIDDQYKLGTREFLEQKSPAALEEMTAVMLETIRKGMWKATPEQTQELARLHAATVEKYGASESPFVTGNEKLRAFIDSKLDAQQQQTYRNQMESAQQRDNQAKAEKGTVLEKQELTSEQVKQRQQLINGAIIVVVTLVALVGIGWWVRRRRKQMEG